MSSPLLEMTEKSVGFKNVSIPKLTLANSIRNFEIVFQKMTSSPGPIFENISLEFFVLYVFYRNFFCNRITSGPKIRDSFIAFMPVSVWKKKVAIMSSFMQLETIS